MKLLLFIWLLFLTCAFTASNPRPFLRNQFTSDKMKDSAREVQRQALHYPNSYFS
ncbi:MAG: hypothetical protein RMJ87_07210 [Cytophagales bacterium]|nr:hypothetical protein [Bernardetiaceae bacterium]MDW8204800.1 hypothetical protein [Cytophagales bacterium]